MNIKEWIFGNKSTSSLPPAHVVKGAVLVRQEGDNLIVKIKCEECGAIDEKTRAIRILPGVESGFMFRCSDCGSWDEVKVYCPKD
jgi:hypothetical protein